MELGDKWASYLVVAPQHPDRRWLDEAMKQSEPYLAIARKHAKAEGRQAFPD